MNRCKPLIAFLTVIGLTSLLVSSCKKNISGIPPLSSYSETDFNQVFEAFWSGMNTNYVFWGIDTVNWDEKYTTFKPLFAQLDINNPADIRTSLTYFDEMTKGLIDCHYNLSFIDSVLSDTSLNPARQRKESTISPALPFTWFSTTITSRYFSNYYWAVKSFQTTFAGKLITTDQGLVTGLINNNILYLHINQFYLEHCINDLQDSIISNGWNYFLSNLTDTTKVIKGLIIDMRNNNGGEIEDLNFILGHLISQPLTFASTREKNGNGRLDYTPWVAAIVTPAQGAKAFAAPIVVLTDQRSVSMAEITTMALKVLPQTRVIGDTTWGATGPLDTEDELYGGGQFSFANFGYVYTSSAMYKYINGKIYEGKGFPPDQYLPYNQDSVNAGLDPQLEAAISYITK